MSHLIKLSSGHLSKASSGHLGRDLCAWEYKGDYLVTISGFSGACAENNGSYTVSYNPSTGTWLGISPNGYTSGLVCRSGLGWGLGRSYWYENGWWSENRSSPEGEFELYGSVGTECQGQTATATVEKVGG